VRENRTMGSARGRSGNRPSYLDAVSRKHVELYKSKKYVIIKVLRGNMFVKVCGLKTREQIDKAIEYGYNAIGVVTYPKNFHRQL
jgi:hypothetical protein